MAVNYAVTAASSVWGDYAALAGATALSVAMTLRVPGSLAGSIMVSQWGPSTATQAFLVRVSSADELALFVQGGGLYRGRATQSSPLVAGAVLRAVLRWSAAGTMDIWINGSQETVVVAEGFNSTVTALEDSANGIGVGTIPAVAVDMFQGTYQDVAVWTAVVPDGFAAAYGRGLSPRAARPNGVLYSPMVQADYALDEWGGALGFTTNGTTAAPVGMYYPH